MNPQEVILVTEQDEAIGVMEKMEAHQKGVLHRAFSVFIFDKKGRMLLQQRAPQKYHGAYLWTNACCSHPMRDEPVERAAQRRLMEEMGFQTPLEKIFAFMYKASVENNLIEHEYDHVFAGEYEGTVQMNPEEVCNYAYYDLEAIKKQLQNDPERFTSWFRIAFPQIEAWWKEQYAAGKYSVETIGEQEKE
ncbi:MAG TPA: isopentenyl-diphosphate Delta-isomerase [Flavisolibacter sp.]|jgi:isopentenyl-diphosphate delta-isomerase|nr:isopentenyl-diphosphate Delta-isomerase [Flavisolibacter sp.]